MGIRNNPRFTRDASGDGQITKRSGQSFRLLEGPSLLPIRIMLLIAFLAASLLSSSPTSTYRSPCFVKCTTGLSCAAGLSLDEFCGIAISPYVDRAVMRLSDLMRPSPDPIIDISMRRVPQARSSLIRRPAEHTKVQGCRSDRPMQQRGRVRKDGLSVHRRQSRRRSGS